MIRMRIADQCRSAAAQLYAASLNPWSSAQDRARSARAAEGQEQLAAEIDRLDVLATKGAALDKVAAAVFDVRRFVQ